MADSDMASAGADAQGLGLVQAAYGIIAEVESHPFDRDTMLFMDWRDDHTASDPQMQAANRCGSPSSVTAGHWCQRCAHACAYALVQPHGHAYWPFAAPLVDC